ncbi:hypothetical protein [Flavobacterium sp.]|uniref:hypothetical protein n=1 Tax=Flavobacterium sp. TaxID=239 RepID=UPI002A8120FB|nr:hypothetical protein [Flavobacterium sp.]
MDVIQIIAKCIIVLFGLFLVYAGFLMFFKPERVREIIGKAGSTYFINYTELGIRLIIGIAFLISSLFSIYELQFKVIGYFLMTSALLLMLVPIKTHNNFAKNAAAKLKPIYLKICAPFSIFLGTLLLIAIYNQIQSYLFLN